MSEIIDALNQLEREKNISKEVIMDAIEKSLASACERDFGKDAVIDIAMDRETGDITCVQKKTVVEDEDVMDPAVEISLTQAQAMNKKNKVGDEVSIPVKSKEFGRIAAQKARSIIVQAIKESERDAIFDKFVCKEKDIITGVVQRFVGNNISVTLDDRTDTILSEKEQVKGEHYRVGDRIKLFVVEVKKSTKGFRILVSRTHPELVRRLFEKEIAEIADGTVEIMSIAREAGSRTKIAVRSNDPNVDPVGACVGLAGNRVNTIVDDLKGEKIDVINYDDDPAVYIKNALSPSDVLWVKVEENEKGEKSAKVVVPEDQLSLAIGKEGQNARLAVRLTGYKIDIKSESQAKELGLGYYDDEEGYDEKYDDEYDEEYEDEYDDEYDEEYDDKEYEDYEDDKEYDDEYEDYDDEAYEDEDEASDDQIEE